MGQDVSWIDWFIYAAPFSIIMSILLYFVMTRFFKAETDEISGGRELIDKELAELGPIKAVEWRLIIIATLLLIFCATEGILHAFDLSSFMLIVFALMLSFNVVVYSW